MQMAHILKPLVKTRQKKKKNKEKITTAATSRRSGININKMQMLFFFTKAIIAEGS